MNIKLLAPWFPERWEHMNDTQLYAHFAKAFMEARFVRDLGSGFEQILASRIFGGQMKENFAKEFNDLTKEGKRKCMANEYFYIWARSVLKQIIKPERYMLGMTL